MKGTTSSTHSSIDIGARQVAVSICLSMDGILALSGDHGQKIRRSSTPVHEPRCEEIGPTP